MIEAASLALLAAVAAALSYLYLLLAGAVRRPRTIPSANPQTRFALAIPAHDEEAVISDTVDQLLQLDYPRTRFDIFVVADYCADATAERARQSGATCWERNDGTRRSKGAALAWLFERIYSLDQSYDAVVVFDADTIVGRSFLKYLDARLSMGEYAIQGNHRIINPNDSWFALLTWAMFIIDNRIQNLGRANLGWSAKNMGDSICFRTDVVRRFGWGEGLTDDYILRQRLLLQGKRIAYEPSAIGYGQAPRTWTAARTQRERWLSGTYHASRQYAWTMLREGLRRRDAALLDGAAQALLPSFSTLTLICGAVILFHVLAQTWVTQTLMIAWGSAFFLLLIYPLWGLALERAPLRAYVAMLLGPVFIIWRTILSIRARFGAPVVWVRTTRRNQS